MALSSGGNLYFEFGLDGGCCMAEFTLDFKPLDIILTLEFGLFGLECVVDLDIEVSLLDFINIDVSCGTACILNPL